MTATQNLPITFVAVDLLRIDDQANVRRINRGAEREFIASIKAIGVRQPLIARKNGKGYVVADGGKRLEAVQALVKTGDLPADTTLPVIVTDATDAEARELSLALNLIRADMHPVDAFRAFAALHTNKQKPLDVNAIATRFGIGEKLVQQRLALGRLDDSVLDAWRDGRMDADAAQAFTLCPDKKAQAAVLTRLSRGGNRIKSWDVKSALKIGHNNPGRLLNIVGIAAYEKRGGKVTRDLFGGDHIVQDTKLLKVMVNEAIEQRIKKLLADGWAWATDEVPNNEWNYGRLDYKQPTREDHAKVEKLRQQIDALEDRLPAGQDDTPELIALEQQLETLQDEIASRSYTPEQKKKAGCFVSINNRGDGIEIKYGRVKPGERKVAPEQGSTAKTKAKAARKGDDHVSNALVQRLSEQLTAAASIALVKEPVVAMAAMLAGFASNDKTVSVEERGLTNKRSRVFERRSSAFNTTFESMLKKKPAELQAALAQVAAKALDFQVYNSERPPLKDAGVSALCNAINPVALNKAIRDGFDAKDYFESVSRSVVVAAVKTAMGADHAARVAKMKKPEAAKFAIANVPKTGWLPPQLRTAHYDGPQNKTVKAKAKKTAKAKR